MRQVMRKLKSTTTAIQTTLEPNSSNKTKRSDGCRLLLGPLVAFALCFMFVTTKQQCEDIAVAMYRGGRGNGGALINQEKFINTADDDKLDDEDEKREVILHSYQAHEVESTRKQESEAIATKKTMTLGVDKSKLTALQRLKLNPPPLEKLVSNRTDLSEEDNIKGDIKFLLDFAILGHAKAATTYVMKWLLENPQVHSWSYEVCDLYNAKPATLARKLYTDFPPGLELRGFKCPGHFARRNLRYFRRYYSNTKLIVGLRHPISWFESYYNFRNRHQRQGFDLPDADLLIGACSPDAQGVCTDNANFHANLAMFGKTNMSDPHEQNLLRLRDKYELITPINNPVFLYDVAQLYDKNKTRSDQLRIDLENFLGLETPLTPDFVDTSAIHSKEARIRICDDKYRELRSELLKIGTRASMWIRKYFIESDEVVVSNKEHFESILKEWKEDPCDKK